MHFPRIWSATLLIAAAGFSVTTDALVPYAAPTALGQDISSWLQGLAGSQIAFSKLTMFSNINPDLPNTAKGTVVAAKSGPSYASTSPDYQYNWVRDSSLTFDVVNKMYKATTDAQLRATYEALLFQYAQARAQEQTDLDQQTGLGEPKFNLDNSVFTGPWGRPQNDGPATTALALMDFANAYIASGGSIDVVKSTLYDTDTNSAAPIKLDLMYVLQNWNDTSFDLWEEGRSTFFYTQLVQRKAILQGAAFATLMDDSDTSDMLSAAASSITSALSGYWDPARQFIAYEIGPVFNNKVSSIDTAVLLGIIHGYNDDELFSFTNDQVLSSTLFIVTSFLPVFEIAGVTTDQDGNVLGIPVGRYPEDVYDGYGQSAGNPWFLCTATAAEVFYRVVVEYKTAGSIEITSTSLPFFTYFASSVADLAAGAKYTAGSDQQFEDIINALLGWGDAFLRRVKYHAAEGGNLSEQFNRDTGFEQGAQDLTWSYAALITAALARAEAVGDLTYAAAVADLPIS